jgi:16S rRNA (cytidine1402-2'-O)-methyltransferase
MAGVLYIVATPIGNLEDITRRAARILGEVDRIACEDTRQTRKLLDHLGISKPAVSYHEHNEAARASELVEAIQAGQNIALVSDAGTPLVSDPGYRLVTAAIAAGITVVPIPGPSAAIAALSASGLPADAFRFGGFLPPKKAARRKTLEQLKLESATLIFYEAPHRILETLDDIAEVLGARRIAIARELTKMHEEILRGTPAQLGQDLASRPSIRGEMTLLIARAEEIEPDPTPVAEAVEALEQQGLSRMDAIKQIAKSRGLSKREVYKLVSG